ncbi:c-type cytochrome [Bradyrhizobium sp. CB1650]|uniref:c-type cytochrome n=1 Tax=Bradyrhizobium sp. CB1650 TaxID=3039153 RepID=UPI002435CAC2|nr:c-type cytochrome [Bradyrhizobium sp. CB1650]WGD52879.1 c-type cytochrome [Bradyrhizobium sp. CB1650]
MSSWLMVAGVKHRVRRRWRASLVGTAAILLPPSAMCQDSIRRLDVELGEQVFNSVCRTCHSTKNGDNRLGPHLHNIVGRKAGAVANFGYSSAIKGAGFVWDEKALDRFIANPDEAVPGNGMKPYGGLPSADTRARLLLFLQSLEQNQ